MQLVPHKTDLDIDWGWHDIRNYSNEMLILSIIVKYLHFIEESDDKHFKCRVCEKVSEKMMKEGESRHSKRCEINEAEKRFEILALELKEKLKNERK